MKTIEQFYNEAKDNRELQEAFEEAVKNGTCDAFLKEHEVDGTLEDLEAYGKAHFKTGELSDNELEQVAGGELKWGSYGKQESESDVRFEFSVGDRVEVYNCWLFGVFTNRGTIMNRRIKMNSSGYYHPEYYVMFDGSKACRWRNQDSLSY